MEFYSLRDTHVGEYIPLLLQSDWLECYSRVHMDEHNYYSTSRAVGDRNHRSIYRLFLSPTALNIYVHSMIIVVAVVKVY